MDHVPLSPSSPEDARRWIVSRQRRRMLTGRWSEDLRDRMQTAIGAVRREAWGHPDMSANALSQVVSALAVLYDVVPRIEHDDPTATAAMSRLLGRARWSAVMQAVQRMTLGCRECLVRYDVDVVGRGGGVDDVRLRMRPVYSDLVVAVPGSEPDQPGELLEARVVRGNEWGWEHVDADGDRRVYVEHSGARVDVTDEVWPEQDASLVDLQGVAIMPYVLYHAEVSSRLWDPDAWHELVEATLNAGVLWTFFGHSMRNASWPQRYMIDAVVPSDEQGARRSHVHADPSAVLLLERAREDAQPMVGAWTAASSPADIVAAVSEYERRVVTASGVPASDIVRLSGDPRSGYAIQLSSEGRNSAARRYAPAFRASDVLAIQTVARMVNMTLRRSVLPETGWRITYRALPPSEREQAERQTRVLELLDRGLIDLGRAQQLLDPARYDEGGTYG